MSEADTVKTTSTDTAQLREKAVAVKDDVRELGRAAVDLSQDKLREAREFAGEYVERGKRKAGELEDSVVTYVRENPVKSVLMSAGAGALLAFLLSRR